MKHSLYSARDGKDNRPKGPMIKKLAKRNLTFTGKPVMSKSGQVSIHYEITDKNGHLVAAGTSPTLDNSILQYFDNMIAQYDQQQDFKGWIQLVR